MKQSIKKPAMSKAELKQEVIKYLDQLKWSDEDKWNFMLAYFTAVDLDLILQEIKAKQVR